MSERDLRAEVRIPVIQRGKLATGDGGWFPCVIMDMSANGFQLVSNNQLAVGQIFDFRCELEPGEFVECMIEVMHTRDDTAGAMITEIDQKSAALLQMYLLEKYADRLGKPKQEDAGR